MGLEFIDDAGDSKGAASIEPAASREVALPKDLNLNSEQQAAYKDFDKNVWTVANASLDSANYKTAAAQVGKDLQTLLGPADTRQKMKDHLNEVVKENTHGDHHFSVVSGKDKAGNVSAGILYRDQSGWDLATGMMPGTTVSLEGQHSKKGN